MQTDYRETCKEIGRLGATLPTFIRNICRTRIDGTSISVMESHRAVLLDTLAKYTEKYPFCDEYYILLDSYTATQLLCTIEDVFTELKPKRGTTLPGMSFSCKLDNTTNMPKIACLSCKMPGYVSKMIRDGKL